MRKARASWLACLAGALFLAGPLQAAVITIDFESFNVGDGLATINAATGPAITLAAASAGAQVVDVSGNKALRTARDGAGADLLLNFGSIAESVSVEFLDGSGDAHQLTFYNQPQNATALNSAQIETSVSSFAVGVVSFTWSDVFGDPSRIRATQIEQSGANGQTFRIDNIVVNLSDSASSAPAPSTLALLAAGVAGLGWRARRRVRLGEDLPSRRLP